MSKMSVRLLAIVSRLVLIEFHAVKTINKLFLEQHKTIKDMSRQYQQLNLRQLGMFGKILLDDVDKCVEFYLEQVSSMLTSADVAQNAVRGTESLNWNHY